MKTEHTIYRPPPSTTPAQDLADLQEFVEKLALAQLAFTASEQERVRRWASENRLP